MADDLDQKSEASIRVQEFSLLKVPYEALNRKWRTGQKILDKELHCLNQSALELTKATDVSEQAEQLVTLKRRIHQIREKVIQISNSQSNEWYVRIM